MIELSIGVEFSGIGEKSVREVSLSDLVLFSPLLADQARGN